MSVLNKGVTASTTGAAVDLMNTVSSVSQAITGTVETFSKALGTLNLKAGAMYAKAETDTRYDIIVHKQTAKDTAAMKLAIQKHAIQAELKTSTELSALFLECSNLFD